MDKCNKCQTVIYDGDEGYYDSLCPDCVHKEWEQESKALNREYERSVL